MWYFHSGQFFLIEVFKKIIYYLFGCIRSQLRHTASSLCEIFCCGARTLQFRCVGSKVHGLGTCSAQAQLLHDMWNLSSPTRDRTHIPCIARKILNHWTTREVSSKYLMFPQDILFDPWFITLFNSQVFGSFPAIFLLLITCLIPLWSENILCMISSQLYLLRFVL